MQSLKFCTYEGTIAFFDASSPDGDVSSDTNTPKVGDTLTATVTGAAVAKYEWSLNGTVVATTATYEVPAIAKSGDRIKLTVTAEDGETASDSVYVGGFSILKVEPTTAMTGDAGYKYVRATFSNALKSLSEADIEIRDVKTGQLYSVEKVALSTDGYTADITIAGDAAVAGTTFLQPSTIYSCTMSSDGLDATLEFQLPDIWSDMLVTSVDVEKNTITVFGSVRKGGHDERINRKFNVGDTYDDNLGELVGRTVVLGLDADDNITSLKVNDGEVAFGYVTAKDGDGNGLAFSSSKDYFETASGDKYYLSETFTSSANYSMYVYADNSGNFGFMDNGDIDPDDTFEYGKLVLNPNGTVSAAVLWTAFDDHIFATTTEGSVAKETKDNSKDFKGYTVIDGETLNYIDPTEISEGDIIYFDSDDKLAFVYNNYVEGDLENVYEDKLDIDGTKYNFIVWREGATHVLPGAKNAEYYDADNDTYELVTEKWANTIDKTEPVTMFLDTKGDGVLVDATVGETVTHSKEYIVTKSPKAYISGLDYMIDMSVSDGTEVTLHINAADITSMNGDAFGSVSLTDIDGNGFEGGIYEFTIDDNDGKRTSLNDAGKAVANNSDAGSDDPVDATDLQQGSLVEVIYNDDETKVTGLNLKLGNQTAMTKGTLGDAIPDINMKEDKDTEFKAGLSSIKTETGSLNLTDSTKVYVLTGTRLPVGELENDGDPTYDPAAYNPDDPTTYQYDDTTYYKEASDNKVKLYNYSDFDQNTQAGNYALCEITNEADAAGEGEVVETTGTTGIIVGELVRFVADGTTAKVVVIDNRGWNNAINTNDAAPHVGTVRAATDIKGGQVFKTAKTETKVLGVAKSTEYQLNSDGVTKQLAEITIITADGDVTLDDIDAKIDTDQDAKNKIVLAELDATGKVTKLNEFAEATGAAAVEQVNFGGKGTSTGATETLKVTSTAGFYNVKTDSDCLVLKWSGSSYSESTIGDINRDDDYVGVKFYTAQLNGSDVKAKVIVATKNTAGAGLLPVATSVSKISAITSADLSTATITITGAEDSGTIYLSDDTTIGDADDIAIGTFTASGAVTLSSSVSGLTASTPYYTVIKPDQATVYSPVISTATTTSATATLATLTTTSFELTGVATGVAEAFTTIGALDQFGDEFELHAVTAQPFTVPATAGDGSGTFTLAADGTGSVTLTDGAGAAATTTAFTYADTANGLAWTITGPASYKTASAVAGTWTLTVARQS